LEHVPYGPHPAQFGELTDGGEGAPVAVTLHGGFWRAAYDLSLMRALAADLARRGWTVWNLEYRRLGDGGGWPATLEDVAAGIDHLAALPHTTLDLSRVVAIGHSAGGHLAALAATRPGPSVLVTGVVSQAGVLDLERAWEWRLSRGVVRRLLDGTPEERPERYAAASPAARLPIGVPTLLTHGGRDETVPPAMSEAFAEAAGCELVIDPDAGHFEHLDPGHALWQAVVEWL
jgi:acetyl esterase/lipase